MIIPIDVEKAFEKAVFHGKKLSQAINRWNIPQQTQGNAQETQSQEHIERKTWKYPH